MTAVQSNSKTRAYDRVPRPDALICSKRPHTSPDVLLPWPVNPLGLMRVYQCKGLHMMMFAR